MFVAHLGHVLFLVGRMSESILRGRGVGQVGTQATTGAQRTRGNGVEKEEISGQKPPCVNENRGAE